MLPSLFDALTSPLALTLEVFALILVLTRLRVPLAAAILIGSATAGLVFREGVVETARGLGLGLVWTRTLAMIFITSMILVLSECMRRGGQMELIVGLFRRLLRRPAVAMGALPALIGLLPMPGGALFSAPMVRSAAGEAENEGGRLSAINYWFRHIWEFWWPLYPGVILATDLTGAAPADFAALQLPLTFAMVVAGLWIFRGTHADLHVRSERAGSGLRRQLVWATSSIWITLGVWLLSSLSLRLMPEGVLEPQVQASLAQYAPIGLGLLVGLLWTVRMNRVGLADLGRMFIAKTMLKTQSLVVAVMLFQFMLKRVQAAEQMGAQLDVLGVPVLLVVVILPFIAGLVTGLAIGFVGTSFPLVLKVLPASGPIWPFVMLAYLAGHMGMMLSPLHLCHVLSNRYFETPFPPVYRRIVPPFLMMAAFGALYFLILRWVL